MQIAKTARALGAVLLWTLASAAPAGEADVIAVKVRPAGAQRYDFDVTVRSRDTGWDYYAERFEVVAPDGTVLGTRVLLHSHETEQPFTRALDDVYVPPSVDQLTVRAWMKRGAQAKAAGGETMRVQLR